MTVSDGFVVLGSVEFDWLISILCGDFVVLAAELLSLFVSCVDSSFSASTVSALLSRLCR